MRNADVENNYTYKQNLRYHKTKTDIYLRTSTLENFYNFRNNRKSLDLNGFSHKTLTKAARHTLPSNKSLFAFDICDRTSARLPTIEGRQFSYDQIWTGLLLSYVFVKKVALTE